MACRITTVSHTGHRSELVGRTGLVFDTASRVAVCQLPKEEGKSGSRRFGAMSYPGPVFNFVAKGNTTEKNAHASRNAGSEGHTPAAQLFSLKQLPENTPGQRSPNKETTTLEFQVTSPNEQQKADAPRTNSMAKVSVC